MTDDTQSLVRFARLPRRGLLLGLSATRVACLALALLVLVPSMFVAGLLGALIASPVWGTAAAAALVHRHGRPVIEWAPTAGHYLYRALTSQLKYRAIFEKPRPAGTLALPGDAAAMRFLIDKETGAAVLHDPHAKTLTAVAVIRHPAFVLLSSDEQAQRVNGWSRTLAHLASTGLGARVQVMEISVPDAGHGIGDWWDTHQSPEANEWVRQQYDALVTTVVPASATHRTLAALSIDLKAARAARRERGHGMAGTMSLLRQEMTSFAASLRAADLLLGSWLGEAELTATIRTAYEPGYEHEDHADTHLETAGPVSVDEHWDHVRHDCGYSAVLWISEWPRVEAPPSFLHALVFQQGVRQTVSLTYEPVPADEAMRDIRRARVEYATDAAQKSRLGMIADLADAVDANNVVDREQSLIQGHADIRLTGLITLTATSREELESAVAETARAAVQSGCETRRLYGQQARAFTAGALPLARKVAS